MRSISEAKLYEMFTFLAKDEAIYLPADDSPNGESSYCRWKEGTRLSRRLNTVRSAKDFFFPPTETLAEFKTDGGKIQVIDPRREADDFIVFGVRGCDVASFGVLDSVFLADPVDTYYANRRRHGLVISLACDRPAATCFCPVYGIDATRPGGDITAWRVEDVFYFEPNTDKGRALMEKTAAFFADCGDEAVREQQKDARRRLDRLPFAKLDLSAFKGENMMKLFNSPKWDELSRPCLGCGTCTFVCPTCQCFDIRDFDTGHGVKRFRCWDSCMYSDYTQMAAANPRHTQKERFRQRFMHKLVYGPMDHNGVFGCVGCGRCLQKCPVSMNIVKVIKTLGEET